MLEKLEEIKNNGINKINECKSTNELEDVRRELLGKKSALTDVLKTLGSLDIELKKQVGMKANEIKNIFDEKIKEKNEDIINNASVTDEIIDITLPGKKVSSGALHPITQMCYDLNDAFLSLGFEVFSENDITSEKFAFDNLNFSKDHPARASMDTYWIKGTEDKSAEERLCLRPHLTGGSVRYLLEHGAPARFVYPGRVYRNENVNARKNNFFHQIEGLYVDKNITFGDLKGVLNEFIRLYFGSSRPTRFRSSFFPFTEPSAEIDVQCIMCEGKGCRTCSGTGWLEILGCGMVDTNVLKNVGIDPEVYSGFAFGMGVERIAMLKWQVKDLRHYFENDMRFLKEFETSI